MVNGGMAWDSYEEGFEFIVYEGERIPIDVVFSKEFPFENILKIINSDKRQRIDPGDKPTLLRSASYRASPEMILKIAELRPEWIYPRKVKNDSWSIPGLIFFRYKDTEENDLRWKFIDVLIRLFELGGQKASDVYEFMIPPASDAVWYEHFERIGRIEFLESDFTKLMRRCVEMNINYEGSFDSDKIYRMSFFKSVNSLDSPDLKIANGLRTAIQAFVLFDGIERAEMFKMANDIAQVLVNAQMDDITDIIQSARSADAFEFLESVTFKIFSLNGKSGEINVRSLYSQSAIDKLEISQRRAIESLERIAISGEGKIQLVMLINALLANVEFGGKEN